MFIREVAVRVKMKHRTGWFILPVLSFICVLSVCACSPGVPAITIEDEEAILSPMIVGAGSIFMKIVNSGSGDDTLLNAQTDISGTIVELHDMKEGRMIKVNKIPIPSKSTVQLRPAGFHLMIFKMSRDVKAGHEFTMTLTFKKSGEIRLPLQFTCVAPPSSFRR
jgi:copper(I)-binding protein